VDNPPSGFEPVAGARTFDVGTTARFTAPVEVCLAYDPAGLDGRVPHLFELSAIGWQDITASAGCGASTTLGTFALFVDATPPLIVANVVGTKGNDPWYTSDVTVTWDVSDPQTPISSSPCATVKVVSDTTGMTLTCNATSDGGTVSESVTVKRDATAPTIACVATPATLWPPTGKFEPVSIEVTVDDATSGAAGFVLSAVPPEDAVGFELGTADVFGLLRAERLGNGGDRVYTLTYTAHDFAGNAGTCDVTVSVPHDRGT
jgi:hypothetical protein